MPEQAQGNIRIKDPQAPASEAQMGLLTALAENGVVTAEEMASLGDSPTKQAASDLIGSHFMDDGFKAVQEARRAQRSAATPQRGTAPKQPAPEKSGYANVKIPSAFITPHDYAAKSGKTFEKAYVHFPEGTKVDGIDLSHYSCDVFMNDRMKQQMLSGGQVTVGFRADKPVEVWTGKKDDPEHPYQKSEFGAWSIVTGIKNACDAFKAEKAAEREQAKGKGVSLRAAAEEARESSTALEGHDVSDGLSQSR